MSTGIPLRAPPAPYLLDDPPPVSFSVIVPVYQGAAFIGEALASLARQTRRAEQVIVSDDGSTDDLDGALREFADQITLVRGANAGPGVARNRALEVARGSFVVSLDADDVYLPDRLERLEQAATARPDLDVITTDAELEQNGEVVAHFHELTAFAVDGQRTAVLDRCYAICPAIRRARLLAVGGYDAVLPPAEDWDLLIRLVLSGCTVGLVDLPLYRYRLRPDSLTANRVLALGKRVEMLERLRGRPGLNHEERYVLGQSIAQRRLAVRQAVAELALLERRRDARRAALSLAFSPTAGAALRAQAIAWASMPRRAANQLSGSSARTRASAAPSERKHG